MTFWQIDSNGFAVIHNSFLNNIGQSYRLCLQFVWQLFRRRMSVGGLGSYTENIYIIRIIKYLCWFIRELNNKIITNKDMKQRENKI